MGFLDQPIARILEDLRPLLADAETRVTSAFSGAIQGGIDRLSGAKITITIELPPPKALPADPA